MKNHSPLFISSYIENELENYHVDSYQEKINIIKNWVNNKSTILNKTERELQPYFFEDIFIKILSYDTVVSGNKEWSINIESSTEVDGKKPDGTLGNYFSDGSSKTLAVIELKGPSIELDIPQNRSRTNYGTPVEQGYQYATKYDGCKWIIVSNIYEIRLYQLGRSEVYYESFELKNLIEDEGEFKKFHFLLAKPNLLEGKIKELGDKAYRRLEDITTEFYELYSNTRLELWNRLIAVNRNYDENILLEKAQKILDRIIFICFSQSRGLLPSNILNDYISEAENVQKINIWQYLKSLFRSIDVGNKDQNINHYNGELFKQDPVLDYLEVPDDVFKPIKQIASYDFTADLNVNILGHIFEQSISDIESLKKKDMTSQRKKEGIFYTPEYITKYMVEHTLGQWLSDKRMNLGYENLKNWQDTNSLSGRTRRVNTNYNFWSEYISKMDEIKILDPACGSGAFLNQSFKVLLEEKKLAHSRLNNLEVLKNMDPKSYDEVALFEQPILLDLDRDILTNNLYGVDLNKESLEISKLSLWLNTANPSKKLANLGGNLKCGNSLIDNKNIQDNAFNWNIEYSKILNEGGFDIVIGNPPYVLSRDNAFSNEEKTYFLDQYELQRDKPNTYLLFIEKALKLTKENGYLGFIVPNSWLGIDSAIKLREYLIMNTTIKTLINLYGIRFPDANVETVILIVQNRKPEEFNTVEVSNIVAKNKELIHTAGKQIPQVSWSQNRNFIFDLISDEEDNKIIAKIHKYSKKLEDVADPKTGLQAYEKGKGNPVQTKEDVENRIYDYDFKYDDTTYRYLAGGDVSRYGLNWSGEWLKYGEWLSQPRTLNIFSGPRLLVREVTGKYPISLLATYVDDIYLNNKSVLNVLSTEDGYNLRFILAVLNSKVTSFYFKRKCVKANRTLFPKITKGDLADLPIPIASKEAQEELGKLSVVLSNLNSEQDSFISSSLGLLKTECKLKKINKKLQLLFELDWDKLIDEIKNINPNYSVLDEGKKLYKWFNENREIYQRNKRRIERFERTINNNVFDLYNLDPDEKEIIESYTEFSN